MHHKVVRAIEKARRRALLDAGRDLMTEEGLAAKKAKLEYRKYLDKLVNKELKRQDLIAQKEFADTYDFSIETSEVSRIYRAYLKYKAERQEKLSKSKVKGKKIKDIDEDKDLRNFVFYEIYPEKKKEKEELMKRRKLMRRNGKAVILQAIGYLVAKKLIM